MRSDRHSTDVAGAVCPQISDVCRAGNHVSASQKSVSEGSHPCLSSPRLGGSPGMFLSPLIPWKGCVFHQLLSPLKITLFYTSCSQIRVSAKKDPGAALCSAPGRPIGGFPGEQLVGHLPANTPFFGEQLSRLAALSSGIDPDLRQ